MIARALTIAIATSAAGCSFFLLDGGFTSDDEDASMTDATTDGATDAANADAPPGVDGGGDVDAASLPFCQTVLPKPMFCDDFERTDPKGTWNEVFITNGGTLYIEPSVAGRSLVSTMPIVAAGDVVQARLMAKLGLSEEVLLSYKLRIDALATQGSGIQVNDVLVTVPNKGLFAAYLFLRTTGPTFVEQTLPNNGPSTFLEHKLNPDLKIGVDQRITVHMTFGSVRHLQVRIDGVIAYDGDSPAFEEKGTVEVSAGIHYTEPPAGALTVRVDDLYANVK